MESFSGNQITPSESERSYNTSLERLKEAEGRLEKAQKRLNAFMEKLPEYEKELNTKLEGEHHEEMEKLRLRKERLEVKKQESDKELQEGLAEIEEKRRTLRKN